MESTGVYWIPLYELLVERGFEVLLSMLARRKTSPAVKPMCSTASGFRSCTLMDCYAVRFALSTKSASYGAICVNDRC